MKEHDAELDFPLVAEPVWDQDNNLHLQIGGNHWDAPVGDLLSCQVPENSHFSLQLSGQVNHRWLETSAIQGGQDVSLQCWCR